MDSTKQISIEHVKQAGVLLKREHEERLRLEKVASGLQLEKRAEKIAFREVELGIAEPFRSYEEFQEKVASLLEEGDLDVVEKALDRGYAGSKKVGGLDTSGDNKLSGKDVWNKYILTGELELE